MMKLLKTIKHRRIIKTYARKLGASLIRRYGSSEYYTSGQVNMTLQLLTLPASHAFIGHAMFLDEPSFNQIYQELQEEFNYQETRQEISDVCFGGQGNFSITDVIRYAPNASRGLGLSGHYGGDCGDGADGGSCGAD